HRFKYKTGERDGAELEWTASGTDESDPAKISSVDNNNSCDQRDILYYAYEASIANYGRAFRVLENKRGVMARHEYLEVRQFIDVARERSEDAREALDKHTLLHG